MKKLVLIAFLLGTSAMTLVLHKRSITAMDTATTTVAAVVMATGVMTTPTRAELALLSAQA